ncbi:hypothetical protein IE4803_PB00474 (plasmid) [Rhizobium etli bv. phaseoli str. IE4803]|nr:hypothetical protein IE4803_PB00474 [Rhizobium etli bv. phaseoli str. IE4803]
MLSELLVISWRSSSSRRSAWRRSRSCRHASGAPSGCNVQSVACGGQVQQFRQTGMPGMRASTLGSHACGSISFILALYADRRTMPIDQFFADVSSIIASGAGFPGIAGDHP